MLYSKASTFKETSKVVVFDESCFLVIGDIKALVNFAERPFYISNVPVGIKVLLKT